MPTKTLGDKVLVALFVAAAVYTGLNVSKRFSTDSEAEAMRYQVEESVYMVSGDRSRGTGFVVENDDGELFMVTNSHVCEQELPIMEAMDYEGNTQLVFILEHDPNHDLCILTPPSDAKPLPIADRSKIDEKVFIVGYPLIEFMTSSEGYLKGYHTVQILLEEVPAEECVLPKHKLYVYRGVDEKGKKFKIENCVLKVTATATTVPSDGGASGSPLLNADGEVVGVAMAVGGNVSWASAVPLENLKDFINRR